MAAPPAGLRGAGARILRRWSRGTLVPLAVLAASVPAAATVPSVFSSRDVVLVVAPHPDDETLCCAGVIQRARAAGARVAIVWLTGGDAFELDAIVVEHRVHPGATGLERLAVARMAEARVAAGLLGVPADAQFFLGYPDRGLNRLLADHYYRSFRSRYTGAQSVPYAGVLTPGAAYQGRNLERDLAAVIERVHPTLVLAPTPLDAHPDHRAAGELTIRIMGAHSALASVDWWIVHTSHRLPGVHRWPVPRGLHADLVLTPPRGAALPWRSWELTSGERIGKERAARAHRTQMEVMAPFLLAFVRRNELYADAPLPEQVEMPPAP